MEESGFESGHSGSRARMVFSGLLKVTCLCCESDFACLVLTCHLASGLDPAASPQRLPDPLALPLFPLPLPLEELISIPRVLVSSDPFLHLH